MTAKNLSGKGRTREATLDIPEISAASVKMLAKLKERTMA